MMLSRLPLLSQSRARAARRDTCTLNSVKSCPQVLDTFRILVASKGAVNEQRLCGRVFSRIEDKHAEAHSVRVAQIFEGTSAQGYHYYYGRVSKDTPTSKGESI